jgi:GntR family transcriptional regulator
MCYQEHLKMEDHHESPGPRYIEIAKLIALEIENGALQHGARLQPERELANQFDVSVGTVRRALSVLEESNNIKRVQGSGNYVNSDRRDPIYAMFRLELRSGGGEPTAQILDLSEEKSPSSIQALGISESATRIRRLRFLNNAPIGIEEIWLDRRAGQLDPRTVQDSLYATYREQLNVWISRAVDRVNRKPVPQWSPPAFRIVTGTIAGFIERQAWDQHNRCIEISWTWFDPAEVNYVQYLR